MPAITDRHLAIPGTLPQELAVQVLAGQTEYANAAATYSSSLAIAVRTVLNSAVLLQTATRHSAASHELVSWRVDGTFASEDDQTIDFATRAWLEVTPIQKGQRTPSGLLDSDPLIAVDKVPRHLRRTIRALGKAGVHLHDLYYYDTQRLQQVTGQIVPMNQIRLTLHDDSYTASPTPGEKMAFPRMPTYGSLATAAFHAHAEQVAGLLPQSEELTQHLARAAMEDALDTPCIDDREAYLQYLDHMPSDMPGHMLSLGEALYGFDRNPEKLSSHLASCLRDPWLKQAAELMLLNQWSYRRHIQAGRYTVPLTAQLAIIRDHGPAYQTHLLNAISARASEFVDHLDTQLDQARSTAANAQAFAAHLNEATMPLDDSWQFRVH